MAWRSRPSMASGRSGAGPRVRNNGPASSAIPTAPGRRPRARPGWTGHSAIPLKRQRWAVDLGWSNLRASGSDEYAREPIHLDTLVATVSLRVFASPKWDVVDIGAGAGGYWFTSGSPEARRQKRCGIRLAERRPAPTRSDFGSRAIGTGARCRLTRAPRARRWSWRVSRLSPRSRSALTRSPGRVRSTELSAAGPASSAASGRVGQDLVRAANVQSLTTGGRQIARSLHLRSK